MEIMKVNDLRCPSTKEINNLSLQKVGRMVYILTRLLLEEHLFRVAAFVMLLHFLDTLLFCTTELIMFSVTQYRV